MALKLVKVQSAVEQHFSIIYKVFYFCEHWLQRYLGPLLFMSLFFCIFIKTT